MGVLTLQYVMEKRFHNIKQNFQRASLRNNITFDYDVFIETYIKCNESTKNSKMDEKQLIQYFWVSFLNNSKKELKKKLYKVEEIDIVDEDGNEIEIIDETFDDRKYRIFDYIVDHVKENFDENSFNIWYLHFAENKSYEELKSMGYTNINFHNTFRNINNSIKFKLPKINKDYDSLVKEIF